MYIILLGGFCYHKPKTPTHPTPWVGGGHWAGEWGHQVCDNRNHLTGLCGYICI